MAGNPIAIKMIGSTIEKTIRDIKYNPQRGIKNLVDLANRYTSSPLERDLIKRLQPMLISPISPYYNIVPSLVNNVNHNTLKTFIINMAYNSFSHGREKNRHLYLYVFY